MKSLTLIRHAKSSWNDTGLADFDRPLNDRGFRDVKTMGRLLAGEGFKPDHMISSPALRALTTARLIAEEIGFPPDKIQEAPSIYEAPPSRILAVIREIPDEIEHAVVVGHNPGTEILADLLLYRDDPGAFATCAIAEMRVLTESWRETDHDTAELVRFRSPKMIGE